MASVLREKFRQIKSLIRERGADGAWLFLRQTLINRHSKRLYRKWTAKYDTLTDDDRKLIRREIETFQNNPLISIVTPVYNVEERWLRAMIESVLRQLYQNWELCLADDASPSPHIRRVLEEYAAQDTRLKIVFRPENNHISAASNSALELARGEFTVLLDHDDELSEHALYFVVREINAFPDAAMIYSDEDVIDEHGNRREPKFKPDFSPDLFYSVNLITHLSAYRTSVLQQINGFRIGYEGSQDYDLALRFIEQITFAQIRHIPHILYHWRAIAGSVALGADEKSYAHERARAALRSHFERVNANVAVTNGYAHLHRVSYKIPEPPPLVTIVLAADSQDEAVGAAISSLTTQTGYENFELLVVTADQATSAKYRNFCANYNRVRVLFSKKITPAALRNFGAEQASGEILVFFESGMRVDSKNWLREMTSHVCRAEIGAVGARIIFSNGMLRHGGYILSPQNGVTDAHQGWLSEATGNFVRAQLIGNFSAVSSACLAVRRDVFQQVNGFDEENFPNKLFDADLCLRLNEIGLRNIWTPYASLIQTNSLTVKDKTNSQEPETICFKQKWEVLLNKDFYYNPNLETKTGSFFVAIPPRFAKPWRNNSETKY